MHGLSFDKGPWLRVGFHGYLYIQGCFATGGAIQLQASICPLASGLSVSGIWHYIEEHCEKLIGHLDAVVGITVEQFWYELPTPGVAQYDLYHCHLSGLWLWNLWDIYEWYCYFIAKLYWEAWGLFWKRSVSLFLRGVLFLVGCLLVFWLGCLVFVLAVCLCWLLLFGWMGDTLGIVSLYSHAWEWTISTNGLMTVRASSAHGTRKKKKFEDHKRPVDFRPCIIFSELGRRSISAVLQTTTCKRSNVVQFFFEVGIWDFLNSVWNNWVLANTAGSCQNKAKLLWWMGFSNAPAMLLLFGLVALQPSLLGVGFAA